MTKSVEELELSVRSANCLRSAGIKTIGELVQKSESAMLKYRNFGRKSLKEISDILGEMGLQFGMDVSPYAGKLTPPPEFDAPGSDEFGGAGTVEGSAEFGDTKDDGGSAAFGEADDDEKSDDEVSDEGGADEPGGEVIGAEFGEAPEVQDDIEEGSSESEDESEEGDETLKTPEEPTPATTPSEE